MPLYLSHVRPHSEDAACPVVSTNPFSFVPFSFFIITMMISVPLVYLAQRTPDPLYC